MSDLKKEFNYYIANKESIFKEYNGLYIVIKDQKIIGSYQTQKDAIAETSKKFEIGSFLVQHVLQGEDQAIFHSRVAV